VAQVIQFMAKRTDGATRRKVWQYEEGGQHYTITEDPLAPPNERFVWECHFVRTYRLVGNGHSLGAAAVEARKTIHSMNKHVIAWEDASDGDKDITG
jgi:hypothetical protein